MLQLGDLHRSVPSLGTLPTDTRPHTNTSTRRFCNLLSLQRRHSGCQFGQPNNRQRVGYMDIRDRLADVHLAFRYLSVLIEDRIVLPYSTGMRVCRG